MGEGREVWSWEPEKPPNTYILPFEFAACKGADRALGAVPALGVGALHEKPYSLATSPHGHTVVGQEEPSHRFPQTLSAWISLTLPPAAHDTGM
eukprot:3861644-Rhodomonas_salina.2